MSDVVIKVERLSKKFRIGGRVQPYGTLRETIVSLADKPMRAIRSRNSNPPDDTQPKPRREFWALSDINFEVHRGSVLGIIGRNGAGKSTLLKVLSQITEPTQGEVRVRGRVASLLEVGTGFHPELTGRENIFLNGVILGMHKSEISRKFDEIVAFAEVERFLDTPVKHYSSGMHVRLAFAVAAHLEPNILLVDEVLAVGDAAFQKRCLGKMEDVAQQGRTIVFVSHDMAAVKHICDRVILLDAGRVVASGSPTNVISSHLSSGTAAHCTWMSESVEISEGPFTLMSARAMDLSGRPTAEFPYEIGATVALEYVLTKPALHLAVLCRVQDSHGQVLWTSWDTDSLPETTDRKPGRYFATCRIPGRVLRPGLYFLSIGAIVDERRVLDFHDSVLTLNVSTETFPMNSDRVGVVAPVLEWTTERHDEPA